MLLWVFPSNSRFALAACGSTRNTSVNVEFEIVMFLETMQPEGKKNSKRPNAKSS